VPFVVFVLCLVPFVVLVLFLVPLLSNIGHKIQNDDNKGTRHRTKTT
jgi:hypothetical protein